MGNFKAKLIMTACILLFVLLLGRILWIKFEGEKPTLKVDLPFPAIGAAHELPIFISDEKTGLRRIWVSLLKNDKEIVLLKEEFPVAGFFKGGKIHEKSFKLPIKPRELGISEGSAVLRVEVRDLSWWGWWNGSKALFEQEVMVDIRPPRIDVLSEIHNITQGGASFVVYRIFEPCPENGVFVGKNFFPAYPAGDMIPQKASAPKESDVMMAFIALDYRQGPETDIYIKVADRAGNSAKARFRYYIRKRNFKKDTLNISDRFLDWKMPEFDVVVVPSAEKQGEPLPYQVEKFLTINRRIREENEKKFMEIVKNGDPVLHWEGIFSGLPGSAKQAGFADRREYKYGSRIIDTQDHMGVDLASVAHSPVPAGNKGKVVFTGFIGIYGETVVIDHGMGLFSAYSHLTSIDVQKGQMVSKGEIIGRTGVTGLAAGDHLHFGMILHNTFVNPIEWWDARWIKTNITNKIELAKSRLK